MAIIALPLLSDNYAWFLVDAGSRDCAVIDPSESEPVLARVRSEGWNLRWVLATHHHWDHTGGNEGLAANVAGLEVLCSDYDMKAGRVPGSTRGLEHGEAFLVAGSSGRALSVPGHTLGAVAFHFPSENAVFTGDTLFTAGCGRLFEGSAAQMYASLNLIKSLPPDTNVYCGHEYTEKNLLFGASLGIDVARRLEQVSQARREGKPTVPETLAVECRTNPFLLAGSVEDFSNIRRQRDAY